MGLSTPTVTMMLDAVEARYAGLLKELDPVEREAYRGLVLAARRHLQCLNRRADLDFERPLFFVLLLSESVRARREAATLRQGLQDLQERLREVERHGVAAGRAP